eukprot:scaffold1629_cov369-Prasinococcus_capsulatus_cf.AAC.39
MTVRCARACRSYSRTTTTCCWRSSTPRAGSRPPTWMRTSALAATTRRTYSSCSARGGDGAPRGTDLRLTMHVTYKPRRMRARHGRRPSDGEAMRLTVARRRAVLALELVTKRGGRPCTTQLLRLCAGATVPLGPGFGGRRPRCRRRRSRKSCPRRAGRWRTGCARTAPAPRRARAFLAPPVCGTHAPYGSPLSSLHASAPSSSWCDVTAARAQRRRHALHSRAAGLHDTPGSCGAAAR